MTFLNPQLNLLLIAVLLIWLVGLTFFFWRMASHYQGLTDGITKKDLKSVLDKLLTDTDDNRKKADELKILLDSLKKENVYNVQKIGFVRFNPFADTGGNQSFSLAVLDGEGSGLVISSLHSRDATRVYAKPVKKEKGIGYDLSNEEKQAIKNARRVK